MWIPSVIFVPYRTLIPTLTFYSYRSAASKPSARPDLMLGDSICTVHQLSVPINSLLSWLHSWFPNRSHVFFFRAQNNLFHPGRITPQHRPHLFSPSLSLEIGSLPYVQHALLFHDLWWYSPPSFSWPHP